MPINTLLADNRIQLTEAQKRAAQYIMDHYEESIFLTASKLAEKAGVSEATDRAACTGPGIRRLSQIAANAPHQTPGSSHHGHAPRANRQAHPDGRRHPHQDHAGGHPEPLRDPPGHLPGNIPPGRHRHEERQTHLCRGTSRGTRPGPRFGPLPSLPGKAGFAGDPRLR